MRQFLLPLHGRSGDSKQKENRKENTYETQRMVRRKPRENFIQTNSSCKCLRKKYSSAVAWFP
jgi:hypothetical protein